MGVQQVCHNTIIVAAEQKQADELCRLLCNHRYCVKRLDASKRIDDIPEIDCLAAILIDLDTTVLSNIEIRNFKRIHQQVPLITISRNTFHPDLRESMQSHIFACISKPVDPEELIFLLNSAIENGVLKSHPSKRKGVF